MRSIRVLHCPTNIAGNPQGLARAERELGLESWVVSFEQSPGGYATEEVILSSEARAARRELARLQLLWSPE